MFEGISGSNLTALYIDSAIFFLGILCAIVLINKVITGVFFRYFFYIYTVITFSIFNIFVKPVQDYLIPIPRTFIFYFKFGGFSLFDLFILSSTIIVITRYLFIGKKIKIQSSTINTYFIRDIIIYILGFIGAYTFTLAGGNVEWESHIRLFRGVCSSIVFVAVYYELTSRIDSYRSARKILNFLLILNLINLISELISGILLRDLTWQRAGHSVFMIDQTNSSLLMIYLPILLVRVPLFSNLSRFVALVSVILLYLDYHKISYLHTGLGVLLIIIIGIFSKRRIPKIISSLSPFIIGAFVVGLVIFSDAKTDDKRTREGQIDGVMTTFAKHPLSYIWGIGVGGMFPRQKLTEDGGEIRAIDLAKFGNEQSTIQIPFLFQLKEAGFLAVCLVLGIFFLHFKRALFLVKIHWFLAVGFAFQIIAAITNRGTIEIDPQAVINFLVAYLNMAVVFSTIRYDSSTKYRVLQI